jgi:paraquat-inducible protein A
MKLSHKNLKNLTIVNGVLLFLGIMLPTMNVKKLYFFDGYQSILSFTFGLLSSGDVVLFLIVFLFSIIFPFCKIFTLYRSIGTKPPVWIESLGKWSLMEVFAVALIVYTVKTSHLGTVFLMPGFYFFVMSIFLSLWLTSKVAD